MLNSVKLSHKSLNRLLTSTLLLSLSLPNLGFADGYHYPLQTTTQFLANSAGELSAINLTWTYAPNEGKQLLADKDLSNAHKDATLNALGQAMLDDLFESGYYTQLSIDGQPTLLGKVYEYTVNAGADQSLTLNFKLPLKTATNLKAKQLELRLVDPDGVATLVFNRPDQVRLDANLAKTCSSPKLSEETMTLPNEHKTTVPSVQISCQ